MGMFSWVRSTIQRLIDVRWHGVYLGIKFFFYLDDVFLVPLCDEVDSEADLPEPA